MSKVLNISIAIVLLLAGTVLADWFPGDDYKMHYPQLPDPFGWDVNANDPKVLADDWQCSETGPVDDIHLWGSWEQDLPGFILSIHVSIHDDVPVDDPNNTLGYSYPGDLLWERDFSPAEFMVIPGGTGAQGWYDPNPPEYFNTLDHFTFHQINITDISTTGADYFTQTEGEIYWLDISVLALGGRWGWKTTQNHWNDDAVWNDFDDVGGLVGDWNELIDPMSGESLDLAFVITPEPVTLTILALGAFSALIRRRK